MLQVYPPISIYAVTFVPILVLQIEVKGFDLICVDIYPTKNFIYVLGLFVLTFLGTGSPLLRSSGRLIIDAPKNLRLC
jgi:hypothetical protein